MNALAARCVLSISAVIALATTLAHAEDGEALFRDKVRPLLAAKCMACHGNDAKDIKGRFDMRSRATAFKGGESGETAIVPGEPEKSRLFVAVTRRDKDLVMPPKENDKLAANEVESIRQWINAGAPWPDEKAQTANDRWGQPDAHGGVRVKTSGGLTADWTNRTYSPEDLWAWRPIAQVSPPKIAGITNPIDAFIQTRLTAKQISPARPADRRTLIRRLTFDLTGLPPTPEAVAAFVADNSADAYARVVERLLKSPRYGEQQARHWLDVTRYADTNGFANDYERPNAWRYRDYVIRAFNADKPYDEFLREQLAGDEIDESDPEKLIAVGFLRLGPWEHTPMTVSAVTRQQFLDDVTHHVGVSVLGIGMRCASCHDHKFDPIPTRDYYRLQAVFATTQFAERPVPILKEENLAAAKESKALVKQRLTSINRIATLVGDEGPPAGDQAGNRKSTLKKIRTKARDYFNRELNRYEPYAFSVYSGPDNGYTSAAIVGKMPKDRHGDLPSVRILAGGSLAAPLDAVSPGVLSAMLVSAIQAPAEIPATVDKRRLAFADWATRRQNTLTARVIVNRVWQQHFGRGLVATPNNFGKMGAKPTHPELLDWLARYLMDNGWSIKKLHRLIVSSATYQQSGQRNDLEKLRQVDADNHLLAFFPPRRLAAEELRDAILAAAGELNLTMGGPGCFPEINWEVALQPRHIMGSVAPAYLPSRTPAERNRRTIYTFRYRTLADPLLEVFNRPGSEQSCPRRDETTIAPQALALLNSNFAAARALALADSLRKQSDTMEKRLTLAFSRLYFREPTGDEMKSCREHLARMTALHASHPPQPIALPTKVRRHMIEEFTGKAVEWEEELVGMDKYQRDLTPWQVDAETLALADVCLVLLNSNEFAFVR